MVYLEAGCHLCHSARGFSGVSTPFAPPLDAIGSRGAAYLERVLEEPAALFPKTVMPSYAGLLHTPQGGLLIAYLLSLRGENTVKTPRFAGAACASCHAAAQRGSKAHRCALIVRDRESFRCARCHAVISGKGACLYVSQRRRDCGVCHPGELDGS